MYQTLEAINFYTVVTIDLVINQSKTFLSTFRSLDSGYTVFFGFPKFCFFNPLSSVLPITTGVEPWPFFHF